jgi:DNA topoisomerase IA
MPALRRRRRARQADQIYNLSLTRTATVVLGRGARGVIGVGRVKTPTLAIVCKRELEIRNFVPLAYFEVVATANVAGGQVRMRHAPQARIVRREIAQDVVNAARGFEGPLGGTSRMSRSALIAAFIVVHLPPWGRIAWPLFQHWRGMCEFGTG